MLEGFPFLLVFVTDLLNMATVLSYGNSTDDFLKGPERMTGILLRSFGESRAQKHLSSKLNILHSLNPKFNMHNFPPVMFLHTKHVSSRRHFLSLGKLTSSTLVHFE